MSMSNGVDAFKSVDPYKPPPEFEEDEREFLTNISLSDSAELWLIQLPANQVRPRILMGKSSLQLHPDGHLGGFQSSSGKSYDVVSSAAQEPEASVFLPSSSDTTLIGKISWRVSLVRYPEPEELEKATPMKSVYQKSSGISSASSRQTSTSRGPHASSRRTSSTRSSIPRSSVSEFNEPSKPSSVKHELEPTGSSYNLKKDSSKRKRTHEVNRSIDHSTQDFRAS